MRKIIAGATTAAVAIALVLVGVTTPASADSPTNTAAVTSTSTTPSYPTSTPSSYPTTNPSGPCIADYRVTYTYDASTNSGSITVPTDSSSSGLLCQSFYVTATSWKYTTNAVWPQTRDVVDALAKISASGTYSYAAAVTCGQGDIYASFDSSPAPTSTLTAPGVPFTEHFLSSMGFQGVTPTYVQQSASCWQPTVEIGSATFTNVTCTPYSSNTVTLSAVPGGIWSWTNGSASGAYAIGAGFTGAPQSGLGNYTYTLSDGDAHDAYNVTTKTATWSPTDASALDCNIKVTPGDPTVTPEVCSATGSLGGSITVDQQTGLTYTITTPDGKTSFPIVNGVASGLAPGDYLVSVTAEAGYELSGATKWPLTVTVDSAVNDCLPTLPVWNAGATGSTAVCTADGAAGTITLEHDIDQTGKVDYTLTKVGDTGVVDLGTSDTSVSVAPGDYVVTASPAVAGDGLVDFGLPANAVVNPDGTISFPVTVAEPDAGACGGLPTDAAFDASASGTSTCLAADGTSGTITLGNTAPGHVDYTITNNATSVTTDLGTTTFSVKVAPGSYTVGAHVVNPADTILEFGAASGTFPAITIAAGAAACSVLHTLAFTGVDPTVPLALAGFLLFLGLGVMLMRRSRAHTAR